MTEQITNITELAEFFPSNPSAKKETMCFGNQLPNESYECCEKRNLETSARIEAKLMEKRNARGHK